MDKKPLYQRTVINSLPQVTKKVSKEKPLYQPFKSKAKYKRKSVYVKGLNGKKTKINYGDTRYKLNYSKKARELYDKRSKKIVDGNGNLTYLNKNKSNFWSRKEWNL